jgi:hypothetical protein
MYLENYSVRVFKDDRSPAAETNGYVSLVNGEKYRVRIRNQSNRECSVDLKIDGKSIGKFYLNAYGSMDVERPSHDTGRLTFYTIDSKEGKDLELAKEIGVNNLGVITAEFTPIKPIVKEIKLGGFFPEDVDTYKEDKSVKKFFLRANSSRGVASGQSSFTSTNVGAGMSLFDMLSADVEDYAQIDNAPTAYASAIPASAKAGATGLSDNSGVRYKTIDITPDRYLHDEMVSIGLRLIGIASYDNVRKLTAAPKTIAAPPPI